MRSPARDHDVISLSLVEILRRISSLPENAGRATDDVQGADCDDKELGGHVREEHGIKKLRQQHQFHIFFVKRLARRDLRGCVVM